MDWGMIQVVVALALLPYVIPEYWWSIFGSMIRWLRTKLRPNEGRCDYLSWRRITESPREGLHICRQIWLCDHSHHRPGTTCWKGTVDKFFNGASYREKVKKPQGLPLQKNFLCVDRKVVEAFILCVMVTLCPCTIHHRPSVFEFGGLRIDSEIIEDEGSETVVLHIGHEFVQKEQTIVNHDLTPKEIDCLLRGYPPFYRERFDYHGMSIRSPISTDADVDRGGWVIAVGLSMNTPIPVYMDVRRGPEEETGMVFWRAIRRVKDVIQNIILPLGWSAREVENIQGALKGLNSLLEMRTESWLLAVIRGTDLATQTPRRLTQEECIKAMKIFNESPRLNQGGLEQLKTVLAPMLFPVLYAALRGAELCVVYAKDGGRELNLMIPDSWRTVEQVYLRGCES